MTIKSEEWLDEFCNNYGLQLYKPEDKLNEEKVVYFERKGDVRSAIKIDTSAQTITFYDVDENQYFMSKTCKSSINRIIQDLLSNHEHWDQLGFSISKKEKEQSYKTDMIAESAKIHGIGIEFKYYVALEESQRKNCKHLWLRHAIEKMMKGRLQMAEEKNMRKAVIKLVGVICIIGFVVGIFYPFVKIIGIMEFIKIAAFAIGMALLLVIGIACICIDYVLPDEDSEE